MIQQQYIFLTTLLQIEYYIVRIQELSLWTDPKSSAIALGVVHLFFAYLAATSNTTFNLGEYNFF